MRGVTSHRAVRVAAARRALQLVVCSAMLLPASLPAQRAADVAGRGASLTSSQLTARLAAVRDGTLRLEFAARDGVCGNGSSWIRTNENSYVGSWNGGRDRGQCEPGPVRVAVERRGGVTTALHTVVGGRWRPDASATDLGTIHADVAVGWLLTAIRTGEEAVAKNAFLPLTIADAAIDWMAVVDVARDSRRPREVRTQAMFWAGQAAGEKAANAVGVLAADDPDVEVRKAAVFALSRRPDGVERLLGIARSSNDREVRRAAYFWLGQSKDPRAVALFAEILAKP